MNFREVRTFVLDLLEKELPFNLYYHGVHHTLDVCNAVEDLSKDERIGGADLELLRTAALLHDLGFIERYQNNESIAVRFAYRVLPGYGYSESQISTVGDIIMCTQIPQAPKCHVEQVMCDADLDYLGREDFFSISENLKKEWLAYGVVNSEEEYNRKQIGFFESHRYFTKTARDKRDVLKQMHLSKLKSLWNGYIVEISNTDV